MEWIQISVPLNKNRFPFERKEIAVTEYAKREAHTCDLLLAVEGTDLDIKRTTRVFRDGCTLP
jgi:hypothetical protein